MGDVQHMRQTTEKACLQVSVRVDQAEAAWCSGQGVRAAKVQLECLTSDGRRISDEVRRGYASFPSVEQASSSGAAIEQRTIMLGFKQ